MKRRNNWVMGNDEPLLEPSGPTIIKKDILTVETVSNHIYFYSHVDADRCLALTRELKEVDQMLTREHLERNLPEGFPKMPIWLHIHSPGGFVFPALGVADQYSMINSPIYSIVEGYCASAATFLAMAANKRFIQPSAFMLIHQVSSVHWGTYAEFQDEMHLLDMLMDRVSNFYAGHSELTVGMVKELLKHDSWFDANECLERGMVDEVLK